MPSSGRLPIDAGLVLCGGQSRRMGRDKARLPIGSELMLARIVRLLGPAVGCVAVVAAQGQELPALPAATLVLRDELAAQGPLAGLASGLAALPEVVDLVYVTATDAPLLQPGWLTLLGSHLGGAEAAVPVVADRWHPLAALYRCEPTLRAARSLLDRGERRMMALVGALRAQLVAEADLRSVDPDLLSLLNANHPADYRAILAHLNGE